VLLPKNVEVAGTEELECPEGPRPEGILSPPYLLLHIF
jgi:hypothetical protein